MLVLIPRLLETQVFKKNSRFNEKFKASSPLFQSLSIFENSNKNNNLKNFLWSIVLLHSFQNIY